jgi:hypothetical protein
VIDVIGFDGLRIPKKTIDTAKDAKGKLIYAGITQFIEMVNILFSNTELTGKFRIVSKDGKSQFIPRLNVRIATDADKKVDANLRLSDYLNPGNYKLWSQPQPSTTLKFGNQDFQKAFGLNNDQFGKLFPRGDVGDSLTLDNRVILEKLANNKSFLGFYSYDFVRQFLLKDLKIPADQRFVDLTLLGWKGKSNFGPFMRSIYYTDWVNYMNEKDPGKGYEARATDVDSPMGKFLQGVFEGKIQKLQKP